MSNKEKCTITCPTCGYVIKETTDFRCPRCYASLLPKMTCTGTCGACASKNNK